MNQNDAGLDAPLADAAGADADAAKDSAVSDAKTDTAVSSSPGSGGSSSGSGGSSSGSGGTTGSGSGGSTGTSGSGGMAMIGGPDCLACEAQNCATADDMALWGLCMSGTDPDGMANAKATVGPAAGTSKKDLCLAVLACVRKNGCASPMGGNIQPCYCGAGVSDNMCITGMGDGPCKPEIEAAAEISSPANAASDVANNLVDPTYALGAANNLVQECDFVSCRSSCLGLTGGSGSGSGGTVNLGTGGSGTGGVTGAGTGGRAGAGGTAGGGSAPVTYLQCRACEESNCPDMVTGCEQTVGNAEAGPAMGQARKDLCLAVVACVRSTKCAVKGDVKKCYCGTVSDGACLGGSGNGVCKSPIEAAGETTDAGDIASRFVNADPSNPMPYALSFADDLVGCDYFFCDPVCANGDPPGTANGGQSGGGGVGGGLTGAAGVSAGGAAGHAAGGVGGVTSTAGANGSGGVVGSGGTTSSGGTTGTGGATGGACPDLNVDGVPDCQETLVGNSTFNSDGTSWTTEYGMLSAWTAGPAADAAGSGTSGGLDVTNPVVADLDGSTMGGVRQCISATAARTYSIFAQIFIPPGQGAGSGALSIGYYSTADCTGAASSVLTTGLVTDTNGWKVTQAAAPAPAGTKSMAVRLVIQKGFRDPTFHAYFDNVLVK